MPNERDLTLELNWQRQHEYLRDPWAIAPILLRPCRVKILMVTDGGGSFGLADFGLRALLDALATPPGPWVRFEVTKANRRSDPTADLQNFRFTGHDLTQYDQIWMFAVERSGSPISDAEVRTIAQFMDGGGGVFATGDHEDLGVAMCGRIPRVRSMRKWHWPNPGPNGEPVAPNVGGPNRYDTLGPGGDAGFQFNDQSDDVPQRIIPRLYATWPWSPYFYRGHPHPLLCGPRGPIRVLPDHPHEGECYVPEDLSAVLSYDGYSVTEYPGGIAPEVIAWSEVAGRATDGNKGALNGRRFGAIGAYDGHRADVGRVVVDATWHHFFNINLIGELGNPDPIKGVGFEASPAGHAAYEDIKAYYRNIAVWLARESTQDCMWWKAVWWARWHHRIVMDVRPAALASSRALDLAELVRIGSEARDALGRVAGQCVVRYWVIKHLVHRRWPKLWPEVQPILDPWANQALPDPDPRRLGAGDPELALGPHAELLLDALIGAAVYGVAAKFPAADEEVRKAGEQAELAEVVAGHVEQAVRLFSENLSREGERLAAFARALAERS